MSLYLNDLKKAWPQAEFHLPHDFKADGCSIDTRTIEAGNIFFAFKGENTDGNRFAKDALAKGAACVVTESPGLDERYVMVESVLAAMQSLAAVYRARLTMPFYGITGSNGKTSSKEMLYSMLSSLCGKGFATKGNYNNHIGVPLSILSIHEKDSFAVIEMGMNHAGEISFLSKLVRPDISIISSIGSAHIEFFENGMEGIAEAKLEILDGMDHGHLIYPENQIGSSLALKNAKERGVSLSFFQMEEDKVTISQNGISFPWKNHIVKNHNYFSHVMASNLTACMEAVLAAGFSLDQTISSAELARPQTERRFQVFRRTAEAGSSILVDDTYNANADSFCASIHALRKLLPHARLAVCAGEMAELGNHAHEGHKKVGEALARANFELVYVFGDTMAGIIGEAYGKDFLQLKRHETLGENEINALLSADGILVKGSHSSRMDIIADLIKEKGYV